MLAATWTTEGIVARLEIVVVRLFVFGCVLLHTCSPSAFGFGAVMLLAASKPSVVCGAANKRMAPCCASTELTKCPIHVKRFDV